MELQDKEEEYKQSVWEIYRKEWATANSEKRVQLNKRMLRWQELMENGWTASQAYAQVMQEESDFRVAEEPSEKSTGYSFWAKMRKAPLIILGLALVIAIVYCIVITRDRNALNTELEFVQSVLASTEVELSSTKETLASTQTDLASTKIELNSTKQTLASTQAELTSTQSELSSTKQSLASTQTQLSNVNNTLTSVKNTLGATKEKLEATEAKLLLYEETLGVEVFSGEQPKVIGGELIGSPNLKNNSIAENPKWPNLMAFLRADPTDDEYYNKDLFNCVSFAEMLHNNAEAKGIKAAFVSVNFVHGPPGHALNAFVTVDKGLVYVDCTGGSFTERWRYRNYLIEYDAVAYVWKGEENGRWDINSSNIGRYRYYERFRSTSDWKPLGIVESIKIYW